MTVVILALILHMLTWKLPGIHAPRILDWSSGRDTRVLQLFFKTLPADDEQEARMENLWSVKSSGSRDFAYRELQQRAQKLIEDYYKEWQDKPIAEQEKLIYHFSSALDKIREPRIEDSKTIADAVIRQNTKYEKKANMIRSVVHKLLEQSESHSQRSIWTPQDRALLWYIHKAVKSEGEGNRDKIGARWAYLRPDQNVRVSDLMDKIKEFKDSMYRPNPKEAAEARKQYHELFPHVLDDPRPEDSIHWTRLWPEEQKAELLYIYERSKNSTGDVRRNMEKWWKQLYGHSSRVSGSALWKRARRLIQDNYEPKSKYMEMAKTKYDNLPSLIVPDRKGKRILKESDSERELKIHTASAGESSKQHHQNVPDYIATPRFYAGHEIQQQHIFGTGYHTAYHHNPHEVHSDSSSSDHSIDKYLNLSYQDSDHST